jgi:hypothetical protein
MLRQLTAEQIDALMTQTRPACAGLDMATKVTGSSA